MELWMVECCGEQLGYFPRKSMAVYFSDDRQARTGDLHHVQKVKFAVYPEIEIERI